MLSGAKTMGSQALEPNMRLSQDTSSNGAAVTSLEDLAHCTIFGLDGLS